MIPDHVLIDAIAHAATVVDSALQSLSEDGIGADYAYRDAYLTLVSRLHDAIAREGAR
ncbi:hypothetical protein [Rhodococcus sp. (in: high G+C Gram-positive bacteria)]|uniref:hypothetical protein n=1 Tax=Rhodococcus sp. TaxID=1831 RepID=UPI00258E9253|nr:hypothetical protein [Rhodococcus sp. (in: high G+C Gram-positive bacteria)]